MEAPVLVARDNRAWLEGDMVLAANAEGAVDDHGVQSGKGGIDVAADHGRLPGDVALACSACE